MRNTLLVLFVLFNIAFFSGSHSAVEGKVILEAIKICGSPAAIGELYPSKVSFSDDWEYVRCYGDKDRKPFLKARGEKNK